MCQFGENNRHTNRTNCIFIQLPNTIVYLDSPRLILSNSSIDTDKVRWGNICFDFYEFNGLSGILMARRQELVNDRSSNINLIVINIIYQK